MINNVNYSSPVNTGYPVNNTGGIAPTSYTQTNNYGTDTYSQTAYATQGSNTISYPIGSIIEDQGIAGRLSKWFINSSDRLLRVGTNPVGKFFINLISGNIPIFTSSTLSSGISNNVNAWIGRADLVRTGATPYHAMLLQDVGVNNVNDLSVITNPADQAVIASMMTTAAANRGTPAYVDQMMVSNWVAAAQQLPKYF